ncbi:unnamed protein product [Cochlearia groenlandica]
MSQKLMESSSRISIESCTSQLLSWRPFHRSKTIVDSSDHSHKPYATKRPCFSDRTTSFSIESLSRLSLADEDNTNYNTKGSFRLVARKRRRRNSRSVSGRSSDRSGTRRCCSVATQGTCSDFPFAVGTDSSGELFGEGNWASDVSEARNPRRDHGGGDTEASGFGFAVGIDAMGNESGYGSEPGYRGDAEIGYGDEFDDEIEEEEEEEDVKPLFWGDTDSKMEISTKFSESKQQFRCRRRRQHDYKTVDSM